MILARSRGQSSGALMANFRRRPRNSRTTTTNTHTTGKNLGIGTKSRGRELPRLVAGAIWEARAAEADGRVLNEVGTITRQVIHRAN
jgi:hypothetical protein